MELFELPTTLETCHISKTIEFDAGHRVPTHLGKCRHPHGHRYKVEIACEGVIIDDSSRPDHGMLVDFGDLKRLGMELVHDVLDHKFITWSWDKEIIESLTPHFLDSMVMFPYIPTAENIARWIWEQLEGPISNRFQDDLRLTAITVYETPTSEATYYG